MHCRELCEFTEVKAKVTVTPFTRIMTLGPSRSQRLQGCVVGVCCTRVSIECAPLACRNNCDLPFCAAPPFDRSSILWHCIAKERHRRRSHRDNTIQNLLPTCISKWQVSCHYPWAYLRLLITRFPVAAYGRASLGLRTCIVIEVRGAAVALFSASEHRAPV